MVSMNEDVNEQTREGAGTTINVYTPASFDFQPVNRKDEPENIVVRLVDGDIHIEQIILDVDDVEEPEVSHE